MILKMAIMFILNKRLCIALIFITSIFSLSAKYKGFTSFDNQLFLFLSKSIHSFALNSNQKLLDKNLLKDTAITNFLIRSELGNNTNSETALAQIEAINKFEILSIGNKQDSLFVAIKYENKNLLNDERYCLLKLDKSLKFVKSYKIIFTQSVRYNYFPKFSELEFTDKGGLVLLFCDSSQNISCANFRFNEKKCSLRIDQTSITILKMNFRFSFLVTAKTVLTPNIYKVRNADLFYLQPFPYIFNANQQIALDPYQSKAKIDLRQKEILEKSGFSELKSLFQNINGNNFIVLNAFKHNNVLQVYVKNLEKNIIEKVSFTDDKNQPQFETIMNIDSENNYFVFLNNTSKYVLVDGDEIEIIKVE
jgi:hypothetical protein